MPNPKHSFYFCDSNLKQIVNEDMGNIIRIILDSLVQFLYVYLLDACDLHHYCIVVIVVSMDFSGISMTTPHQSSPATDRQNLYRCDSIRHDMFTSSLYQCPFRIPFFSGSGMFSMHGPASRAGDLRLLLIIHQKHTHSKGYPSL